MSERMSRVRKAQEIVNTNGRAATDAYLEAKAPSLHDLMTVQVLAGEKVKTVTLILFAEDGKFKCCLNDRDTNRVGFVTLDTVEDVFECLEAKLDASEVEWRNTSGGRFRA